MTAKPVDRASAEDKATNIARYAIGGFGANATKSLGINVIYPNDTDQGITISSFGVDSTAKAAKLAVSDWIMEVDGSAIGHIRGRYYEPWQKYGRSGQDLTEVLVSFLNQSGERKYYYPQVATQTVTGVAYKSLPSDFFTVPKPQDRNSAEDIVHNKARYVLGATNFDKYAAFELGVNVDYSYNGGALIQHIQPGKAAAGAGLKVGDRILEVDGAPIGVFNGRTYEVWRQYIYSLNGEVELLVHFTSNNGAARYYYPKIQLTPRTTGN
jgi:hypothetical protein